MHARGLSGCAAFRRRTRSPRGVTLLEVMVVCVLGVVLTAALIGFGVYMAKLNKSVFSQLRFALNSSRTVEALAKVIRYAKQIEVTDGGRRVVCTDDRGVTSALYYQDADNNPNTLANNEIYYVPNIASPESKVIGRHISPLPGKPVFRYVDRTSAVEINFRVGDPRGDARAKSHLETGPGPQGMDIRTAFGPRNSYMN